MLLAATDSKRNNVVKHDNNIIINILCCKLHRCNFYSKIKLFSFTILDCTNYLYVIIYTNLYIFVHTNLCSHSSSYISICWPLLGNQSENRQINGYGRGVGHQTTNSMSHVAVLNSTIYLCVFYNELYTLSKS